MYLVGGITKRQTIPRDFRTVKYTYAKDLKNFIQNKNKNPT